jgi:WD40 repeat protein
MRPDADAAALAAAAGGALMPDHAFGAYVAAALFTRGSDGLETAAFALGDGVVHFNQTQVEAHQGAVLSAALHPSGDGLVTGGDDGRLVWSRPSGAAVLADAKGKWIDAVAANASSGLIAFSAGRVLRVLDAKDASFERRFDHERSVAAVAFDPKGRRLAAASYGGNYLWYARIAEQKPQVLSWAGSHVACLFSPDGKFVLSAMQENALHGWRLSDGADLRMGGYPAKPRSLAFLAGGALMATSGANGAVVWPFSGAGGPMGKEAMEIGADAEALVTVVAASPKGRRIVAGLSSGRIWTADLSGSGVQVLREAQGEAISALSVSPLGDRVAWGAEDGAAGVFDLPPGG